MDEIWYIGSPWSYKREYARFGPGDLSRTFGRLHENCIRNPRIKTGKWRIPLNQLFENEIDHLAYRRGGTILLGTGSQ